MSLVLRLWKILHNIIIEGRYTDDGEGFRNKTIEIIDENAEMIPINWRTIPSNSLRRR